MSFSVTHSLAIIAVVSLCTMFLRAFPFMVFGGKKEVPGIVRYLGVVLPASIMAVLVVYCLKGIQFQTLANWLPAILASMLVVILHVWKKNILLSIALGTICYMVLIQVVF